MSIRWRIMALGLVGASVMVLALLQFYRLSANNARLATEGARAERIHLAVQRIDLLAYEYLLYGEPRAHRQLALQCAELRLLAGKYASAASPSEQAIARELVRTEALLTAIDAVRLASEEGSRQMPVRARFLAEQLIIASHEMSGHARDWQARMVQARDGLMCEATISGIIATSAMLLLLTVGALLLLRTILRPVERLRVAVAAVAGGDLSQRLPPGGGDELGALIDGFTHMTIALELAARERERALAIEARSAMLERVNRDLEHFAALASHDLQAPLRSISNFTEILQHRLGSQLDDRSAGHLQRIIEAAGRMRALIEGLLRFSRAGSADLERDTDLCSRSALDQALENLSQPLIESAAKVDIEDLPTVRSDGIQLIQIFQNLIANAIAYREPSRPLRIRIWSRVGPAGYFTFAVSDNGPGVASEQQERIFGMFQRAHPSDIDGSGIGLALCRKIVQSRGGIIWVESQPSEGATFLFSMPAAGTPPPSRRLRPAE
jgi:signal transduction histidine kinase